jgi:hypothetical protein
VLTSQRSEMSSKKIRIPILHSEDNSVNDISVSGLDHSSPKSVSSSSDSLESLISESSSNSDKPLPIPSIAKATSEIPKKPRIGAKIQVNKYDPSKLTVI